MAYQVGVYKTSQGNELVVGSSGRLFVNGGTLQLSSGATLTLAGQSVTSTGPISGSSGTFTGSVAITSGITGSSAAITNGITGSSLAITNGITGSSLAITNGITGSSLAITNGITGSSLAITNGITGSSLAITNGITGSSLAITNGITGSSGTFTNMVSGSGFAHTLQTVATSSVTALNAYGITVATASSGMADAIVQHTVAPMTGVYKTLIIPSSVTSGQISILTTGTWDGTNNLFTVATTSSATRTVVTAVGWTTARWQLLWVNASSNYALSAV